MIPKFLDSSALPSDRSSAASSSASLRLFEEAMSDALVQLRSASSSSGQKPESECVDYISFDDDQPEPVPPPPAIRKELEDLLKKQLERQSGRDELMKEKMDELKRMLESRQYRPTVEPGSLDLRNDAIA